MLARPEPAISLIERWTSHGVVDACLGGTRVQRFLESGLYRRARRQSVCMVLHMRFPNAPASHLGAMFISEYEDCEDHLPIVLFAWAAETLQEERRAPASLGAKEA